MSNESVIESWREVRNGLIDEANHVLDARKAPTVIDDLKIFISKLTELIRDFQKSAPIDAIGIGVPGLRSSKTHAIVTSPNIPCLKNVNLEQLVADEVHLKVVSENDANAGAYAEFMCGAGLGLRDLAYLTLGTGLGSGLILNASLYTGASGYGGEFGHTLINPEGRRCGCGKSGCVETVASATGMVITALERLETARSGLLNEVPPPLTAILALPFMTGFAARVRVAPAGRREIPITFALGREAGRGLETARSGRLAFAAGRFAPFALGRALERDLDARFGRFEAEARFFIFLGPLDLAFLLDRFPAIKALLSEGHARPSVRAA